MKQDGKFGRYGGLFVSELLIPALEELETAYLQALNDEDFTDELAHLLATYAGRPTPLYRAENLGPADGARIFGEQRVAENAANVVGAKNAGMHRAGCHWAGLGSWCGRPMQ